jgi:hypothetical protein
MTALTAVMWWYGWARAIAELGHRLNELQSNL